MYEAQGRACAICERPETECVNGVPKRLAVDHDHTTGAVRGLLCQACNTAIGKLRDNPVLMRRAANYVEGERATSTYDALSGRG